MARFKAKLWYEGELIHEPVIAQLVRDHGVLVNIRRANVEDDSGWIVCELEGSEAELMGAIDWLRARGVDVELVGDVVES